MTCAYCRSSLAVAVRDLCAVCLSRLPIQTRQAYAGGRCDTRRAVELLKIRYTSVKELRGGRHTRNG